MGLGMVRKIDELGRVVLPKEMRRVLNIKTGSSVEMEIDEEGKIVLKKFSEIENVLSLIKSLGEILFDSLNLRGFVCDEDKVVFVFGGVNKKEFLDKRVKSVKTSKNVFKVCEVLESEDMEEVNVFSINVQGFEKGFVGVFGKEIEKKQYIELLIDFLGRIVEE